MTAPFKEYEPLKLDWFIRMPRWKDQVSTALSRAQIESRTSNAIYKHTRMCFFQGSAARIVDREPGYSKKILDPNFRMREPFPSFSFEGQSRCAKKSRLISYAKMEMNSKSPSEFERGVGETLHVVVLRKECGQLK